MLEIPHNIMKPSTSAPETMPSMLKHILNLYIIIIQTQRQNL